MEVTGRACSYELEGNREAKLTEKARGRWCEQGRATCEGVGRAYRERHKASVVMGTKGTVTRGKVKFTTSENYIHAAEGDDAENHTVYEEVNVLGTEVECKLRQVTKAAWKDRMGERAALSVNETVRATVGCSDTIGVMGETSAVKGVKGDEEVYCNGNKWMVGRIESREVRYEEKRWKGEEQRRRTLARGLSWWASATTCWS